MYKYYNAHPKGLSVGDCVKRAITVAAQMDYMEVQRELNRYKKVTGAKAFNTDYNPHKYVENVLHGKKLSFPATKGQPRMNGARFCEAYPKGRFILNMAGHWSCCIDGIIIDTWDCSEKCVYTAYDLTPAKPLGKMRYKVEFIKSLDMYDITMCDKDGKITTKQVHLYSLAGYEECLKDFGYKKEG